MGSLAEIGNIIKSNIPIGKIDRGIRNRIDERMVSSGGIRKAMGFKTIHAGEGVYERGGKMLDMGGTGSFGSDVSNFDRAKSLYYNKDGSYNKTMIGGTIAGAYMGVSAAGRIATGGGLYKDSDGNTDIIGVPFI